MKNPHPFRDARGERGFTLIELLVVLALAAILMFMSFPALQATLRQAKLRGIAQETTALMRQARLNAIKTSSQAVVRLVPATALDPISRVEAFSDRNGDGKLDPDEPVLGRVEVPSRVVFRAPPNNLDKASVEGFSPNPENSSLPNVARFHSDGAILDVGAFRFADDSNNFLEVRVAPAATARIEVRKWNETRSDWFANGDNKEAWSWN
jgi:prepilin-type N-terminal cleavage/methylation domain-containing protein